MAGHVIVNGGETPGAGATCNGLRAGGHLDWLDYYPPRMFLSRISADHAGKPLDSRIFWVLGLATRWRLLARG